MNKKGEVVNEDGEPVAKLVGGRATIWKLSEARSSTTREKFLTKMANVIGKVELIPGCHGRRSPTKLQEAKDEAAQGVQMSLCSRRPEGQQEG